MLLLADITFSTESMVVIGAMFAVLTGAISWLHKALVASKDSELAAKDAQLVARDLQLAAKDSQIKVAESERDSHKEIAAEAVTNLETAVNTNLVASGKPEITPIAPVVPEHNSPTTRTQQKAADLQTLRSRLVAATLAAGLPPRKASRPETQEEEQERKA